MTGPNFNFQGLNPLGKLRLRELTLCDSLCNYGE